MAKPHGSVRIGPISLFTLIIVLCLAVLTVLSVTTSLWLTICRKVRRPSVPR